MRALRRAVKSGHKLVTVTLFVRQRAFNVETDKGQNTRGAQKTGNKWWTVCSCRRGNLPSCRACCIALLDCYNCILWTCGLGNDLSYIRTFVHSALCDILDDSLLFLKFLLHFWTPVRTALSTAGYQCFLLCYYREMFSNSKCKRCILNGKWRKTQTEKKKQMRVINAKRLRQSASQQPANTTKTADTTHMVVEHGRIVTL